MDLQELCARQFAHAEGGSLYFEGVERLSTAEQKLLLMVLHRGDYWDPDSSEFVPVRFRILASASPEVLAPERACSLLYRLAERIIQLPGGHPAYLQQEQRPDLG